MKWPQRAQLSAAATSMWSAQNADDGSGLGTGTADMEAPLGVAKTPRPAAAGMPSQVAWEAGYPAQRMVSRPVMPGVWEVLKAGSFSSVRYRPTTSSMVRP